MDIVRFAPCGGLIALAALISGCGQNGPALHAVNGTIAIQGGDAAQLAGSAIEVALVSNRTVRGFGHIGPNGRFQLESLQSGELRQGVLEGTYVARILPNDEDGQSRRKATQAIAQRYLRFETSGLSIEAPSPEDVSLTLTR